MTLHGENMFSLVTCEFVENTENHKSEVNDPYKSAVKYLINCIRHCHYHRQSINLSIKYMQQFNN
jgi:hypothetical protein